LCKVRIFLAVGVGNIAGVRGQSLSRRRSTGLEIFTSFQQQNNNAFLGIFFQIFV